MHDSFQLLAVFLVEQPFESFNNIIKRMIQAVLQAVLGRS